MALIACPDCGGQVSDQALACPHCGRPLQTVPSLQVLRREAHTLQSLAKGCGCLVILFALGLGVLAYLVLRGVVDWRAVFAYTIQHAP